MSKPAEMTSFKNWVRNAFNPYNTQDASTDSLTKEFRNLTNSKDIAEIYEKHQKDILKILNDDAINLGFMGASDMMTKFPGAASVYSYNCFENLMMKYAAEQLAADLKKDS